jgi:hypothetical protein
MNWQLENTDQIFSRISAFVGIGTTEGVVGMTLETLSPLEGITKIQSFDAILFIVSETWTSARLYDLSLCIRIHCTNSLPWVSYCTLLEYIIRGINTISIKQDTSIHQYLFRKENNV